MASNEFRARRASRSYTQVNTAPPAEVFPLLCPVREREWAPGWDCDLVYSSSGYAEDNCVFTTAHPGEPDTVWTVTEHDPERFRVGFVTVTPGLRAGRIAIRLEANGDGTTTARVTYTFTALSEAGNRFVDAFTDEAFAEKMRGWERAINHFLATGTMMDDDGS